MVIDPVAHRANESVFTMFAMRARRRATGSLARQLTVCGLAAETCYDANGRAFACDARGQRR
jgi:hypothetical protein